MMLLSKSRNFFIELRQQPDTKIPTRTSRRRPVHRHYLELMQLTLPPGSGRHCH